MFAITPRLWATLAILGALVTAGAAQDGDKSKHKVVTFAELAKADKENEKSEPTSLMRAGLNRLGKDGWEAIAKGERGIVFRRANSWVKWEYRLVKTPESTLNGKSDDDEVLQFVLDGLSAQGWELCLVHGDKDTNSNMVFKRSLPMQEKKTAIPKGFNSSPDGVFIPPPLPGILTKPSDPPIPLTFPPLPLPIKPKE